MHPPDITQIYSMHQLSFTVKQTEPLHTGSQFRGMSSSSQKVTPFCPLCRQSPKEQDTPATGSFARFRFGICCPFVDNHCTNCVPVHKGKLERASGLDKSLFAIANLQPDEDARHFLEFFNFKFELE